jgi:hypothetical protein
MRTHLSLLALVALLSAATPAFAQIDLSGTWASRNHEDFIERWPGPDVVDFTGLPLNDDGRAKALSYSVSQLSLPERQCLYYGATYTVIGPFGFKLWSDSDPVTSRVISWNMSGAVDKSPRTIWMDGRPHPPAEAPHTFDGFSTGEWQGNTLVVRTTHMKATPLRRNGAITSDAAVMTEYIARHGDILTIAAVIDDPANLAEPHIISRSWQLDPTVQIAEFPGPCNPGIEAPGLAAGSVPHYLPGANPFIDRMGQQYGIPQEAVLGGRDTLYPEFRKRLVGRYTPPSSCGRYCCGWGGGNSGAIAFTQNLVCTTAEPVVPRTPASRPQSQPQGTGR